MNLIITGATGFVGQNLKPLLVDSDFIVESLSLRCEWKQKLRQKYNAIIHLAGKAHDTKNTSSPEEYFKVNTELTKQLFDWFLESSAQDFIYFSSVKAVADTVVGKLDEKSVPSPFTPYGQSKLQAEQYLNSQPLPPDKRLFILRPCMIHGPGNRGNLNLLYKVVSKGIPWPLASFENKRSFLSIDNLNFIIKQLLDRPEIPSGTYHLADDDSLSTNELIRLMGKSRGRKTMLWKIPHKLISNTAKIGDVLGLPLNTERLKKLTESYVVDNTKIKTVLKIDKLPVSAREGLLKTLSGF